ncbi:MAG: alpha-hydroxy-acid oxidizing protein [Bifidobacteriaceae bacterium]|jgi:isopentenyl diphosphate isomerase/L-lactate dehydrogenase-like FMN-dependent dehydrogenase|nr:alpha-hydroxy-acid oxidizing protein [Bifidobacteriaceae bacterium]
MNYQASTANGKIDIPDLASLESQARGVIPEGGFDYIAGGAEDEVTLRRNTRAFDRTALVPRALMDLGAPDPSTSLLGIALPFPVILSPMAAHRLAHADGEKASARALAGAGSIMSVSNYATESFEDIEAAAPASPKFMQIYLNRDQGVNRAYIDLGKASGMRALIFTVDASVGGNRERDLANRFKVPFPFPNLGPGTFGADGGDLMAIMNNQKRDLSIADLEWLIEYSGLPVVVKGVQAPPDAVRAVEAGAAAIWVSNHGGRQLDGGPAAFTMLRPIARALDGAVPVIFDSGVRRGRHVFEALAAGADAVGLGRPALYGLALGGAPGMQAVFEQTRSELVRVMQLAGAGSIAEVKRTRLFDLRRHRHGGGRPRGSGGERGGPGGDSGGHGGGHSGGHHRGHGCERGGHGGYGGEGGGHGGGQDAEHGGGHGCERGVHDHGHSGEHGNDSGERGRHSGHGSGRGRGHGGAHHRGHDHGHGGGPDHGHGGGHRAPTS